MLWKSWDIRIVVNPGNAIIQRKCKFLFWEYWENDIQIFNPERLDFVIERIKAMEKGESQYVDLIASKINQGII